MTNTAPEAEPRKGGARRCLLAGDIVTALVGYSDGPGHKERPVLIVSPPGSSGGANFVAMPLTRTRRDNTPGLLVHGSDIVFRKGDPTFPATGLRETSYVKWFNPVTLSPTAVTEWHGTAPEETVRRARRLLRELLEDAGTFQPAL